MQDAKILSSEKQDFATALDLCQQMRASRVIGSPLRYWPVVIAGPNDGFLVVESGFATSNGFEVIQHERTPCSA
jgi:hypothetical protein